ncbi:MAG: AtpZ/AtpI family protein [Rhodothermales bacterium]
MASSPRSPRPTHWLQGLGGAQRFLGLGIQAGVSVAFYVGIGLLLDRRLGTLPWLTLLGAGLGIVTMFVLFFRINAQLSQEHDAREKDAEG